MAALPLAAAGLLNPMVAGAAMAASSVFVVGQLAPPAKVPVMLERFLEEWLGGWPPTSGRDVVASPLRARAGAGTARCKPVLGVGDDDGRWVVSVSPERAAAPTTRSPASTIFEGVFRWSRGARPTLEPLGAWLPADDPRVPDVAAALRRRRARRARRRRLATSPASG